MPTLTFLRPRTPRGRRGRESSSAHVAMSITVPAPGSHGHPHSHCPQTPWPAGLRRPGGEEHLAHQSCNVVRAGRVPGILSPGLCTPPRPRGQTQRGPKVSYPLSELREPVFITSFLQPRPESAPSPALQSPQAHRGRFLGDDSARGRGNRSKGDGRSPELDCQAAKRDL